MEVKTLLILCLAVGLAACGQSGEASPETRDFAVDTLYAHTPPMNQGRTSTCWAFASASLLESEWMARGGDTLRLSPMYAVRQKYLNQFDDYYYTRGKSGFRAGSLGHSFLRVWREDGLVPFAAYRGVGEGVRRYDHGRLLKELKRLADKAVDERDLPRYRRKAEAVLDDEMGAAPQRFVYQGREYTPRSFADSLGLDPDDYMELASFSHHPFHECFVLEVPDNWEHARYYNLPLDELEAAVRRALSGGYTVVWDGDVSEDSFSASAGIAVWPQRPVTQDMRQHGFEQFSTTDDHMMHIVGTARDEAGKFYYVLKNSYGRYGAKQGMLYMSEDYFRAKTVSVMLNRKALQRRTGKKAEI